MLVKRRLVVGLMLAALGGACNKQPALGSPSGEQTAFAEEYPTRLGDVRARFTSGEQDARKPFADIRGLPSKLSGGNPAAAAEVVRQADAAGRSSYYVDEALNQEGTVRILAEERSGIRSRIAGSVAFTAKEKAKEKEWAQEHADELGASAASASERAIQRELEERLHRRGEATRYIDAQREALGERNVELLEKRADAITWSSYLTHVRLELYVRELEELISQESNVKATLERSEREGKAAIDSGKLSKARRAALEQRLAAQSKARAAIDKELPPAKQELEAMTDKLEALQRDYQALVAGVAEELDRKAAGTTTAAITTAKAPPAEEAASDRNADITGEHR